MTVEVLLDGFTLDDCNDTDLLDAAEQIRKELIYRVTQLTGRVVEMDAEQKFLGIFTDNKGDA